MRFSKMYCSFFFFNVSEPFPRWNGYQVVTIPFWKWPPSFNIYKDTYQSTAITYNNIFFKSLEFCTQFIKSRPRNILTYWFRTSNFSFLYNVAFLSKHNKKANIQLIQETNTQKVEYKDHIWTVSNGDN